MIQPVRWMLGTTIAVLLLGCSSAGAEVQPPSVEDEEVFNRTTSCVNGELPVEIRYALLGKPTLLSGEVFNVEAVDTVSKELDIRIAALLKAAMDDAWKLATAKQKPWSPSFYSVLETEYVAEIAGQAPKLLHISFCGDRDQVGGAAFAAIAGYFSRSVTLEGGQKPKWLQNLGTAAEDKGTSIVMIAVGLRLAKIDFQPELLAKAAVR